MPAISLRLRLENRFKEVAMKHSITALVIPLLMSAAPGGAAADENASCDERYQSVSAEWAETKKQLNETGDVSVATDDGREEVAAKDAEPTENWFGKPPKVETVDGYLAEAERAMEAGDTEACMAQLKNVQAAIDEGGISATGK